ncbi:ADP-ribose polymerase [Limibacter armeniacum]|uniref:ADP-ribose polymerase n=1 Tax=Limibacter armeniacum TaxID=466084 RepID=UPI002FE509D4
MEATAQKLRTCKLIMVTSNNNNKYYEMREDTSHDTFTVLYGRVGGRSSKATYNISQWDTKYNEKIRKGYKDQTHLFAETKEDSIELADIDDAVVEQLVKELMAYASKSISYNYNVTADQVTEKQVAQAQAILDELVAKVEENMDINAFNTSLLELYQIIPRKMGNVKEHLLKEIDTPAALEEVQQMLNTEQETLDVMRGQVQINEQKKEAIEEKQSINLLEAMGLRIEQENDPKVIKTIMKKMDDQSTRFKRAYKVINLRTQKKFDQFLSEKKNKKTELFWHGSRNENWMSIMENGLVLRPAAVINGKMFGYGLYFADKFQKSLNYTSLRGAYWTGGGENRAFLALYNVHVGNQMKIKKHESWCYDLNEKNLKERNEKYDSLYAKGGADLINNEYIVYNEAQCTVQYLVEVH